MSTRTVFSDLLSEEQRVFLDENWGGEFLDVPERMEIVDRSVFRLVQVTIFNNINSRNVLSPLFVYVTLA